MQRTQASFALAFTVSALLLGVGCRPAEPPYEGPRGPQYFNACALFPASEARAELRGLEIGQVSGPLDATSGSKFARCAYGFGEEATVVASLEVRRHESPNALRRNLEASLPLLRRLTKEDVAAVPDFGDVAWWSGAKLRLLKVGWRDLEILVTVLPGDEPGYHLETAKRIARRALLRLAGQPVPEELLPAPRPVELVGSAPPPVVETPAPAPAEP